MVPAGSGWVPDGSGWFRQVPGGFRVVPAGSGWVPRFTYTRLIRRRSVNFSNFQYICL